MVFSHQQKCVCDIGQACAEVPSPVLHTGRQHATDEALQLVEGAE